MERRLALRGIPLKNRRMSSANNQWQTLDCLNRGRRIFLFVKAERLRLRISSAIIMGIEVPPALAHI